MATVLILVRGAFWLNSNRYRMAPALALLSALMLSTVAPAEDQAADVFKAFAKELREKGDPDDVLDWRGRWDERGIGRLLREGDAEALAAYTTVGVAAEARYPRQRDRMAEYWRPYALILALPTSAAGRPAINQLLNRDDVSHRIKGWVLGHLLENTNRGASLSWLDAMAVAQFSDLALREPVFLKQISLVKTSEAPRQRGGPPKTTIVEYDVDSAMLATQLLQELIRVDCDAPNIGEGLLTEDAGDRWKQATVRAEALLPVVFERVRVMAGTAKLIDHRDALPVGPEQLKALVRVHTIGVRADPASFLRLAEWAMAIAASDDGESRVVANELLQLLHRGVVAGAFLPYGLDVAAGDQSQGVQQRLTATRPLAPEACHPEQIRAWLLATVALHKEAAAAGFPAPLTEVEWAFVAGQLEDTAR